MDDDQTTIPPWADPSWLTQAQSWMLERGTALGFEVETPVECVRNSALSCILRAATNRGDLYLKQAAKIDGAFCDEPTITAELAKLFPHALPRVLAVEAERRWMLSEDFGHVIPPKAPLQLQKQAYKLLAAVQREAIEHVDRLLQLGVADRRPGHEENNLNTLLHDRWLLAELQPEEVDRLTSLAPWLDSLAERLGEHRIPATLVHGDFRLGNVASSAGRLLIFDWTDSAISHPFFDLTKVVLLKKVRRRRHLRDAYLSEWTRFEDMEQLREAWDLAIPLGILHRAVSHRHLGNSLGAEAGTAYRMGTTRLLRCLLGSRAAFPHHRRPFARLPSPPAFGRSIQAAIRRWSKRSSQ